MEQTTVVVFGQSGFGKSSFINYVLGSDVAETGVARSITHQITAYEVQQGFMQAFTLIDTIGLGDTEGKPDNQIYSELLLKVQDMFFNESQAVHKLKLIFLLSAKDSRINLVPLKNLICRFGPDIISSTLILLTKVDKVHSSQLTPKVNAIKNDLGTLKQKMGPGQPMPPFVNWSNKNPSPEQEQDLITQLNKIKFYTPKSLQNILLEIRKESDRIYAAMKKTNKVVKTKKEKKTRKKYIPQKTTQTISQEIPITVTENYLKPVYHEEDNHFLFFKTGTTHWTTYEEATREKTILATKTETKEVPNKEEVIEEYFEDVPYYEEESLPQNELNELRKAADKEAFKLVAKKYVH